MLRGGETVAATAVVTVLELVSTVLVFVDALCLLMCPPNACPDENSEPQMEHS